MAERSIQRTFHGGARKSRIETVRRLPSVPLQERKATFLLALILIGFAGGRVAAHAGGALAHLQDAEARRCGCARPSSGAW